MTLTNRNWLPGYCDPNSLLPAVQETIVLFQDPPYLFQDFVARTITFLRSDRAREAGFVYDPKIALPCKWKCSDESVFGVDLCLYAFTGHYPFDKGGLGGCFNEKSLGAAVHHAPTNIDFGGAHVGYCLGEGTGDERFGCIQRPMRERESSADCGYLMSVMAPFKEVYDDACKSIFLFSPDGWQVLVSIPNEYLQPSWSSHHVKLLVDVENLTAGPIPYDVSKAYTHKIAGRSLFAVSPRFLASLPEGQAGAFTSREKIAIGRELTADFFHIFDSNAALADGVPVQRFLPYMKYILSSKLAPYPLKAAVTHANIEHLRLVDAVRAEGLRPYSFASFTGVFIDVYDPEVDSYVNLFQPIGASIKAAGRAREVEFTVAELRQMLDRMDPAEPILNLSGVLGYERPAHLLERFRFPPR